MKYPTKKVPNIMPSWLGFILDDDNTPAVIEAVNGSGGLFVGFRAIAWHLENDYYAIHNNVGNQVWCHKDNFIVINRGNVKGMEDFKNLEHGDHLALKDAPPLNTPSGLNPTYIA